MYVRRTLPVILYCLIVQLRHRYPKPVHTAAADILAVPHPTMLAVEVHATSACLPKLLYLHSSAAIENKPVKCSAISPSPRRFKLTLSIRCILSNDDTKEQRNASPRAKLSKEVVGTMKEQKKFKELSKLARGESSSASEANKETTRKTHRILRVIRGTAYGRKLLSPSGMDVRPMMELVRRAAFDILQAASGPSFSLPPGRWLDLYSGTGSVGIEALSRGCYEAHFVEMDPWVVEKVLRPNIEHTKFTEQSFIHIVRVEAFLERFAKINCDRQSFDYVSVTPPYQEVNYPVLMGQLSKSPLIGKDTFILVEHPSSIIMNDSCGSLVKIVDRRYGRTHLAIYGPVWSQKKRACTEQFI